MVMADAETLRSRCVDGDQPAWRALHAQYHRVARAFLRRLGVPPADLEDACQEVFVQVFRYLARFEQRADFKTWLYKLCITQAGRMRRRRALTSALGQLLARPGRAVADPHEWSEGEAQRRVHAVLAEMKEIHRVVFVLYEIEGLTGEELARVTDLPAGTVRRRLHDARAEFTERLAAGRLR